MTRKSILIASDSFKGTLSSLDICNLFMDNYKDNPDISLRCLPIADGGEGSILAISKILDGQFIPITVTDLYFHKMDTEFYISGNAAYIECASCVGLSLANKDNDPGLVTTFGLGEQIKMAINMGIKNIYIFLGGSASNDCGAGLASALGVKFFNKDNEVFIPTGLTLKDIVHIDKSSCDELLKDINIHILSDVKSPLYGVEGAAYKFARQKGADDKEIILLDDGLRHISEVIKQDLNIDISNIPGSGAAGGLGGGIVAFLNGKMASGIDTILDISHFDEMVKQSDIIISGEGKLDRQTLDGKVIDGVAKRVNKYHKELYLIVGISEISLKEIQEIYPCVTRLYETNDKHLPFDKIKDNAKEDYLRVIELLDK